MGFCRFSDNNFQCEFYAYESLLGYELHVGVARVIWDPPCNPYNLNNILNTPAEEWKKMAQDYRAALAEAGWQNIDLPEAGGKYRFDTLEELREGIAGLMEKGFQAPDWLLPSLDEEIAGDGREK